MPCFYVFSLLPGEVPGTEKLRLSFTSVHSCGVPITLHTRASAKGQLKLSNFANCDHNRKSPLLHGICKND